MWLAVARHHVERALNPHRVWIVIDWGQSLKSGARICDDCEVGNNPSLLPIGAKVYPSPNLRV
jgi:hypothetical protein